METGEVVTPVELPLERLEADITELAAHLAAGEGRWLLMGLSRRSYLDSRVVRRPTRSRPRPDRALVRRSAHAARTGRSRMKASGKSPRSTGRSSVRCAGP